MSVVEVGPEINLMKAYSDLKWDDMIRKLNCDLTELNIKIRFGLVTKEELLIQIKAELNVLDTCHLKIDRELERVHSEYIKNETCLALSERINNMYKHLFSKFAVNNSLLFEYIELCSYNELFTADFYSVLRIVLSRYHFDPVIYVTIATFEFDNFNNIESARRIFALGLLFHSDCKNLYVKEFWIEIQHFVKTAGASLCDVIKKYKDLIKRFEGDMKFHFTLLDIAFKLREVGELQFHVVRDMVEKYRCSEFMWQKLAKINFDGFIYHHETQQLHYDKTYINVIRNCMKVYEDGLKENLPLENKNNLWNFYINHVIEIRKSYRMKNETIKTFMNETIERAFQEAHDDKALHKAEHYIYWANNSSKDRYKILAVAVEVIEKSVELWVQLLAYFVAFDSFDIAIEVFQRGVRSLTSNSLSLWEMIILYMQNTHSILLEQLYKEGAHYQFMEINTVVRPQYLDWCAIHKDIFAVRDLFNKLKNIDPPCKQLYTTMISHEMAQSSSVTKIGTIRQLYNKVCNTFGHNDISVWIDCIRFEYMYGSRLLIDTIYNGSLDCLESNLRSAMTEEFEKFKNEFLYEVIVIEDDA